MRPTVGFALCGSFCTFRKAIDALRALTAQYTVVPIFSDAAWETDTRFGASADFRAEVTALCGTAAHAGAGRAARPEAPA